MNQAEAAGALLARRHQTEVRSEPGTGLSNFAEIPRSTAWTLRSALVRLAQPEPVRAAAVLDLVRRCEWTIHPLLRAIERHSVLGDRQPPLPSRSENVEGNQHPNQAPGGGDDPGAEHIGGWTAASSPDRHVDARIVDLARVVNHHPDLAADVIAAYRSHIELETEELEALAILGPILVLDELADSLAAWAPNAPANPPVTLVDEVCLELSDRLSKLGITAPIDPRAGRSGQRRSN